MSRKEGPGRFVSRLREGCRRLRAASPLVLSLVAADALAADSAAKLTQELQNALEKRKSEPATKATAGAEESLKDETERFQKASKFLVDQEKQLEKITASLDLGATADKSGQSDLSRLNLDTAIAKGQYPRQFRFRAGTRLQVKDGNLQEEVAALVVNYDYYLKPWLETFSFAERASDSFLSIRQRYEFGGGFKLERDLLSKPSPQQTAAKEAYQDQVRNGFPSLEAPVETRGLYQAHLRRADEIERGMQKLLARLTIGCSFSVFAEIEQPLIETVAAMSSGPVNGTVTSEVPVKETLRAQSRFRAAVRPSIVIQPVRELTTTALFYLKLPLGARWEMEDRLDYRTDLFLISELKVDKDTDGATASVVGQFEHHYDNVPPRLPDSVLAAHRAAGRVLKQEVANRRHAAFVLKIRFNF